MISLAVITNQKDKELALNNIETVRPYVDEVVLSECENIEDFAQARNDNFKLCKGDWILWMDADDTFTGLDKLKDLVKQAKYQNIEGYGFKYKYNFDANGNCTDEHWKLMLVKNNGHFEWRGVIHEDIAQLRSANWVRTTDIERIHHSNDERTADSYARNLRILLKESEKNPEEPRTWFYLSRCYLATGEWQKVIDSVVRYLDLSNWDEERYEAYLLAAQAFRQNGQLDEAIKWYHDAILEREDNPEAYIYKGMIYLQQQEWKKALVNLEAGLRKPKPDGTVYFNPMFFDRDVPSALSLAYLHTGKFDKAVQMAGLALKADNRDQKTIEINELVNQIYWKEERAKDWERLIKTESNKQAILGVIPKDLSDHPRILMQKRQYLKPKQWPDKSIVVFCGTTAESWNALSADKGIGGSETAVIEISKRLVKQGWQVTVYNMSDAKPEGDVFDGVTYKNYWEFNPEDQYDVLWIWRLPELFDYDLKARYTLLDLHDVINPLDLTQDRLKKINKIFVKTKYHRGLLQNVPDDKFEIIGNGINLERFDKLVTRNPHKFIYSSTPNRGLDIVLEMWPEIKERYKDAELHVFYGWNTYYELEKHNLAAMKWMHKIQAKMNQPGVIDHGRVGQAELAEEMLSSSIWLYPTYFPEIHCITACEMQAAGVIPVTSGYAALAETQKVGVKLEGDVYDPEWQKEYLQQLYTLLDSDLTNLRTQAINIARQFAWDKVADKWNICLEKKQ